MAPSYPGQHEDEMRLRKEEQRIKNAYKRLQRMEYVICKITGIRFDLLKLTRGNYVHIN